MSSSQLTQTSSSQLTQTSPSTITPPKYDYSILVSKPIANKLHPGLLTLHHSFGNDIKRRNNLHVLDKSTIMFASGNLIHFMKLDTGQISYLRSSSGLGIGALAVHPSRNFIAVAENGDQPNINIFSYPELELKFVLKGGTEKTYSHLTFSPDEGLKIASAGGSPDFMLTVWDWKDEAIVLRSKAFSQDVFRVSFAPENDGILTTSGSGHIRFWKMAATFTGLKLQGSIGKFGKREISDVCGSVEFPDGKVLSGCEWGNLLLWEGELIKVEICKKGQKSCHSGNIECIWLDEGEIITVGADGFIKIWDFDEIDQADVIDDNDMVEMEPLIEIKIKGYGGANLKHIEKLNDPDNPTFWVAQNNQGSIWKVDLQVSHTHKPPERLFSYHSGAITGVCVCPFALFAVTSGQDGRLRLYDIDKKLFMGRIKFNRGATCVVWCPSSLDSTGNSVLAGFEDGVVRFLRVVDREGVSPATIIDTKENCSFMLRQVFKPHTKPITSILLVVGEKNQNIHHLITGADDHIFFFEYQIGNDESKFHPVGYITIPAPVVSIIQVPNSDTSTTRIKLLVAFKNATLSFIDCPKIGDYDISISYLLKDVPRNIFKFRSVKYEMLKAARDKEIAEERAQNEDEEDNIGNYSLAKVEEEIDPYMDIPKPTESAASQILQVFYHGANNTNFWLCMSEYDCDYMYECWLSSEGCDPEGSRPIKILPVPQVDGIIPQITCLSYTPNKEYLLTGTRNGHLRVHKVSSTGNLALDSYWSLPMSDPEHGKVRQVCSTFDNKYVLFVSDDGNFFTFSLNSIEVKEGVASPVDKFKSESASLIDSDVAPAKDIEDPKYYSLEEARQRAEDDRKLKLAEEQKKEVIRQISKLRKKFKQIQTENKSLPLHLRLSDDDFVMDRIMLQKFDEDLTRKLEIVELKMQWSCEKSGLAFDKLYQRYKAEIQWEFVIVYSFASDLSQVCTVRSQKPTKRDFDLLDDVRNFLTTESMRYSSRTMPGSTQQSVRDNYAVVLDNDKQLSSISDRKDEHLRSAVSKGDQRKERRLQRHKEWEELMTMEPNDQYQHPDDVIVLKDAELNMGDFKLKTASDYSVPETQRVNASKKRLHLVALRQEMFARINTFNQVVIALRDKKVELINRIKKDTLRLKITQSCLPIEERCHIPRVPILKPEEIPELYEDFTKEELLAFEIKYEKKLADKKKAAKGGGDFSGFGGFSAPAPEDKDEEQGLSKFDTSESVTGSMTDMLADGADSMMTRKLETPKNIKELRIWNEQISRLKFNQDEIIRDMLVSMNEFDARLQFVSNYKSVLDVQLKMSDLRHSLLFKEYLLLKDFEKREQNFLSKLNEKQDERQQMQKKLNTLKTQLNTKQKYLTDRVTELKSLDDSFQQLIANNKWNEFLLHVYRKKVKRVKQEETKAEEGSEDDFESESEISDYSSGGESGAEQTEVHIDDSACPHGCDVALFDKACELREQRMDLEESISNEKKLIDMLKKDSDNSSKKAKIIDNNVKNAKTDLENFQFEKQQRLNELDVLVTLRLSQVLVAKSNGEPPESLKNTLVFSKENLTKLSGRTSEIKIEKNELKRQRKELDTKKGRLQSEKKSMVSYVQQLENNVNEIMMLKFGRKVNLEFFDPVEPSTNVTELQEKLRDFDIQSVREFKKKQKEIEDKKLQLDQTLQQNTHYLQTLNQLLGNITEYDEKLETGKTELGSEFQSVSSHLTADNSELNDLVKLQAHQIEQLTHEIRMLSHKGGHVPPPRQPPVAPSQFMKHLK